MSSQDLETVNAFMKAAAARDYDAALAFVSDDIEYQNMMLPPAIGKDAMKGVLDAMLTLCTGSEWLVHQEVSANGLVMNERTDRFEINGAWHDLPVAGVFNLSDGLIVRWRDYFDLQTIMTAMVPPAS